MSEVQQLSTEGFRLAPQQRRLCQLLEDNATDRYVLQAEACIDGDIDREKLSAAISEVVERNEILRTTFTRLAGMRLPVQVIAPTAELPVHLHDVADQAETDQQAQINRWLKADREQPFDLEHGPLVRVRFVITGPRRTYLLITASSLVLDRVSSDIFLRQIAAAYEDRLDEPEMQYADLAEWQNTLLEDDESQQGLDYWRRGDRLAETTLALPYEQRTDRNSESASEVVRVTLNRSHVDKLCAHSGSEPVALSTALLALWKVLVFRMTGRDAFVLGVGCDGRTYDELAGAMGLFSRDLPMQCRLRAEQTLGDVIAATRSNVEELFEWQEFFSWDAATDGEARRPTFDVSFDFEDRSTSIEAPAGQNWTVASRYARYEPSQLSLLCVQSDDKLAAELHFDSSVYNRADIQRLAEHFSALVDGANSPDRALSELRLLSEDQRHEITVEWNDTTCEYPRDRRIDELFAQQVGLRANEVAVESVTDRLTYAELDRRANQLAHYLQKKGVGPDTLVALCVERSPKMVVAIFAILKAGGAYVPMDPSYPADRLTFMLQDTEAPILVAESKLIGWVGETATEVVCIDRDSSLIEIEPDTPPENAATADNLAYIIYTSGSTGTPKGVEIRHRNLVHSTTARERYYCGSPGRYMLLSSFAFDSSIAGIFWSLCYGDTLFLPPQGAEKDIDEVADLIEEHRLTTLLGLPSLYAMLLDVAGTSRLATLERVIVAGEECPRRLVDRHHESLPQTALFNEYGPTEATVWCTAARLDDLAAGQAVSIGGPIANTRIYILDTHLEPAPVGVAGEIYIGGEGVARGYLQREELTAERFVRDAFRPDANARLYRTGDLARYLSDGNIEFLGRIDHQVKIRGYRIELEEIEHVLCEHPDIAESVVTVHQAERGDQFHVMMDDVDSLKEALASLEAHVAERILNEVERTATSGGDSAQQNGESR